MAKVVGVHEIMLRGGVTESEFEALVADYKKSVAPPPAGVSVRVMRGTRGDRVGRFLMLFEFDSLEAYKHHSPTMYTHSEEWRKWMEANAAATQKVTAAVHGMIFTDYVEL